MQRVSVAVPEDEETGPPPSPRPPTFAEDEEVDMLSPLNSPARSYGNALAEEALSPSTITPVRPLRLRSDSYGNATLMSSVADEADPMSPPTTNHAPPDRLRADSYYSALIDDDEAEAEAAADLNDLLVALDAAEAEADAPILTERLVAPAIDPAKVAVGADGTSSEAAAAHPIKPVGTEDTDDHQWTPAGGHFSQRVSRSGGHYVNPPTDIIDDAPTTQLPTSDEHLQKPTGAETESPTRRRPSHIQAKRQKKARNAMRAKRRAETKERKEARSRELMAATEQKRDLFIQPMDIGIYETLDQNHVGVDRIPDGCGRLNRYSNVLPNPRSRVRLKQVGSDERSGYINANFIRSFDGAPRRYIATQGPLPETVMAFWRLVWEKDSRAIVMVTGLVEKGTPKCARYWPKALYNPELGVGDVDFGDINVRIHAGFRREGFVTTKFHVRKGDETREIWHFMFDSWPDHGVPRQYRPVQSILDSCRRWSDKPEHPWIVHCSAGIGRTGTFIAIDHGIRLFETTGVVDVLEIIRLLRTDRGGMVQHGEQAEFVQNCLESYRQEHGANEDDENEVLATSVERALVWLPQGFEGHESQKHVEEGSESTVPSWRVEQIEEERDCTREWIADLKSEDDPRAGRMQAKEDAVLEKKHEAALLLASMEYELEDDPNDYMSTMKRQSVGHQRRSRRRRAVSSRPYDFEEISSDSEVSDDSQSEPDEVEPKLGKTDEVEPKLGKSALPLTEGLASTGSKKAGGEPGSCRRMVAVGLIGMPVLTGVIIGSVYWSPFVAVAFAVFVVLAIGAIVVQKKLRL